MVWWRLLLLSGVLCFAYFCLKLAYRVFVQHDFAAAIAGSEQLSETTMKSLALVRGSVSLAVGSILVAFPLSAIVLGWDWESWFLPLMLITQAITLLAHSMTKRRFGLKDH